MRPDASARFVRLVVVSVALALVGAVAPSVSGTSGGAGTLTPTSCHGHHCPTPTPSPTSTGTSTLDHIFIIVEENHGYNQIVGSSAAPYLNSLISQNALATQYYALTHPSLPNYLALTGGSTFSIATDCLPLACPLTAPNVADRISSAGRTWKSYLESMPSACYLADSGNYRAHHNPFVYYTDIELSATRCSTHDLPYTNFSYDLASTSTTPSFSLIVPNVCNDMHDCSITTGDNWLKAQLPTLFRSAAWTTQRSLLVIVFDEDEGSEGNHVVCLFVGPHAKPGYRSTTHYNHYSLLRTIETELGLSTLTTNDAQATPMTDMLR